MNAQNMQAQMHMNAVGLRSAVCGEYTPAGVLFILARRPVPRPEGGGFVVVGVGEGARGALGHRGDRYWCTARGAPTSEKRAPKVRLYAKMRALSTIG